MIQDLKHQFLHRIYPKYKKQRQTWIVLSKQILRAKIWFCRRGPIRLLHERIPLRSTREAGAAGSKIKIRMPSFQRKGEGNSRMRLMIIIKVSVQRAAPSAMVAVRVWQIQWTALLRESHLWSNHEASRTNNHPETKTLLRIQRRTHHLSSPNSLSSQKYQGALVLRATQRSVRST